MLAFALLAELTGGKKDFASELGYRLRLLCESLRCIIGTFFELLILMSEEAPTPERVEGGGFFDDPTKDVVF